MELVQVNKLYLERETKECVVVLQGCKSGAQTRLILPEREAAVIALEAHGVNDRCSLYHVLTSCVAHLGGAFCNVTIKLNARSEAASYPGTPGPFMPAVREGSADRSFESPSGQAVDRIDCQVGRATTSSMAWTGGSSNNVEAHNRIGGDISWNNHRSRLVYRSRCCAALY